LYKKGVYLRKNARHFFLIPFFKLKSFFNEKFHVKNGTGTKEFFVSFFFQKKNEKLSLKK
jgi:hypothetical protein